MSAPPSALADAAASAATAATGRYVVKPYNSKLMDAAIDLLALRAFGLKSVTPLGGASWALVNRRTIAAFIEVVVVNDGRRRLQVKLFAVDPAVRRQGLGTLLATSVLRAMLRGQPHTTVTLSLDTKWSGAEVAREFWASIGFAPLSGNPSDSVTMVFRAEYDSNRIRPALESPGELRDSDMGQLDAATGRAAFSKIPSTAPRLQSIAAFESGTIVFRDRYDVIKQLAGGAFGQIFLIRPLRSDEDARFSFLDTVASTRPVEVVERDVDMTEVVSFEQFQKQMLEEPEKVAIGGDAYIGKVTLGHDDADEMMWRREVFFLELLSRRPATVPRLIEYWASTNKNEPTGRFFIVMERMKTNARSAMSLGLDISESDADAKRFLQSSWPERMMAPVRVLDMMHILHGDLKPDNYLLAWDDDTLRLTDFAFSRWYHATGALQTGAGQLTESKVAGVRMPEPSVAKRTLGWTWAVPIGDSWSPTLNRLQLLFSIWVYAHLAEHVEASSYFYSATLKSAGITRAQFDAFGKHVSPYYPGADPTHLFVRAE